MKNNKELNNLMNDVANSVSESINEARDELKKLRDWTTAKEKELKQLEHERKTVIKKYITRILKVSSKIPNDTVAKSEYLNIMRDYGNTVVGSIPAEDYKEHYFRISLEKGQLNIEFYYNGDPILHYYKKYESSVNKLGIISIKKGDNEPFRYPDDITSAPLEIFILDSLRDKGIELSVDDNKRAKSQIK